ncbi:PREDICTED: probable ribosome-binding factor A, chloroplastic isoform X2 [Ipomoea nil]|uniref:probable ribosome-binding factor A, chloroplastic isoform X2 n=1 Tax=Ipomoea nil TaxID=35883 RepID=UPI000900D95C|nr:PREDICTED: probable ribosome-binding factor A, chloroplastic isoform X2 [Ipomoea nil]
MPHILIQNPHLRPFPNLRSSSITVSNTPPLSISPPNLLRLRRIFTSSGGHGSRGSLVKCMANPRRVKMVAKQIRRELSDMLLTDKVLQYAVLPEAALGADQYLSSLTTISDVEVSADLQVVKVYVSVFGDKRGKEVAIAGLKSKAKYVRSELGKRMKLRLTPEIRFIEDLSIERGSRVIAILDRIKRENEKKEADLQGNAKNESSEQSEDDEDWEGSSIAMFRSTPEMGGPLTSTHKQGWPRALRAAQQASLGGIGLKGATAALQGMS